MRDFVAVLPLFSRGYRLIDMSDRCLGVFLLEHGGEVSDHSLTTDWGLAGLVTAITNNAPVVMRLPVASGHTFALVVRGYRDVSPLLSLRHAALWRENLPPSADEELPKTFSYEGRSMLETWRRTRLLVDLPPELLGRAMRPLIADVDELLKPVDILHLCAAVTMLMRTCLRRRGRVNVVARNVCSGDLSRGDIEVTCDFVGPADTAPNYQEAMSVSGKGTRPH